MSQTFAVIDTETNWDNEVMSVGIVIARDGDFEPIDTCYIIFEEAARVGGLFSSSLYIEGQDYKNFSKKAGIAAIKDFLNKHDIQEVFAYNASFDYRCLPELSAYSWHDILRLAAYKQYNPAIPVSAPCCKTGRLKCGYKVEDILQLFGEGGYMELHNALTDAVDELRIMKHLQRTIEEYPNL